jgi:hypothetical protein
MNKQDSSENTLEEKTENRGKMMMMMMMICELFCSSNQENNKIKKNLILQTYQKVLQFLVPPSG